WSRRPSAPPCSASCSKCVARAEAWLIQRQSGTRLFSEFAQDVPPAPHDLPRQPHFLDKLRVGPTQLDSIRRADREQSVALGDAKVLQDFLGKHCASRIADRDKLEGLGHTNVITLKLWIAKS